LLVLALLDVDEKVVFRFLLVVQDVELEWTHFKIALVSKVIAPLYLELAQILFLVSIEKDVVLWFENEDKAPYLILNKDCAYVKHAFVVVDQIVLQWVIYQKVKLHLMYLSWVKAGDFNLQKEHIVIDLHAL
jgi:hypothetical protein